MRSVVVALAVAAAGLLAAKEAGGRPPRDTGRAVTVCSDPWMPYAGDGSPGSEEGYVIALAREALRGAGHEVRYVVVPWSRCIADVRQGRWDAIACVDEREVKDVLYPAEAVGETAPSLFTRPDSTWRFDGLPSLERIRLGAIRSYAYADEVDPWIASHAQDARRLFLSTGTDPLRRLFDMLEAGRVDAVIEDQRVARWALRRQKRPPGSVREAGRVGRPVAIYVAFSARAPGAAELARAFDQGMRAMRADGRRAAILSRYGIADWAAPGHGDPVPGR